MASASLSASRNYSNGFTPAAPRVGTRWRTCPKHCAKNSLKTFHFRHWKLHSQAGFTRHHAKFLWRLHDHALIESVSDSGQSGALRRRERPPYALHVHASRLRPTAASFAPADSMAGNATSRQMKSSNKFLAVERWHDSSLLLVLVLEPGGRTDYENENDDEDG